MTHFRAAFASAAVLGLLLFSLPSPAQAQTCSSVAPFCDNPNYVCQIEPGASTGVCTPPSAVDPGPGTGQVGTCGGQACSASEVCCSANGAQFCATQSQCAAQTGGGSPTLPSQPAQQPTAQAQSDEGFVSLTNIQGLEEAAEAGNFAGLLNNIYLLCVGAGAVLAVLQIMRGGLTYMLSDSVTNKKEAREVIVMALVGLLLVLSPTIVFGIIDPRILSLQINFSGIRPGTGIGTGDLGPRDDIPVGGDGPQTPTEENACANPPCASGSVDDENAYPAMLKIRWTVGGTDVETYYGYVYSAPAQFLQQESGVWLGCYQPSKVTFGNKGVNPNDTAAQQAQQQCEASRSSRPGSSACIPMTAGNSVEFIMALDDTHPGNCPLTADMHVVEEYFE